MVGCERTVLLGEVPHRARMRFSVTSRRPGGVGQPPARLRGTMENASTGQMRSSNPPPGCGAGCAGVRRSRLGVWSHGKVHSAQPVGCRMRFSVRPPLRVRFSVRSHTQSALFRETASRLPSSGKAHSTERRILCRHPHGKAHPGPATSRKSALWARSVPRCDPPSRKSAPCAPRSPRHRAAPCVPHPAAHHATRRHPALYPGCTAIWVMTPPTHPGRGTRPQLGTQAITGTRWYTVSTFGPARSYYV